MRGALCGRRCCALFALSGRRCFAVGARGVLLRSVWGELQSFLWEELLCSVVSIVLLSPSYCSLTAIHLDCRVFPHM